MSSEERGFIRSIIEQPHDDTRRLAYADWLDEHERQGGLDATTTELRKGDNGAGEKPMRAPLHY